MRNEELAQMPFSIPHSSFLIFYFIHAYPRS